MDILLPILVYGCIIMKKPGYLFNNRKHYFEIYHFSIFMVIKLEPALYPTLITIKMEPLPNE